MAGKSKLHLTVGNITYEENKENREKATEVLIKMIVNLINRGD